MRILAIMIIMSALLGPVRAGTPTPSPCALLTKAEVQEAVGAPVSGGVVNQTNRSVCDFKVDDLGSAVSLMLIGKSPGESAGKTVAELKKKGIAAQVISGFGDSAYVSSPGYGMQQIGVYKGSSHLIVTVLLMGASEAKSKTVAERAIHKALVRVP
jgi:hypothetical protein